MNKIKRWAIIKLGGIPRDEIGFFRPKVQVTNIELKYIQSSFSHLGRPGDVPIEFVREQLLKEMVKMIDFPIEVRENKTMCSAEFVGTIELPKKYIKGERKND